MPTQPVDGPTFRRPGLRHADPRPAHVPLSCRERVDYWRRIKDRSGAGPLGREPRTEGDDRGVGGGDRLPARKVKYKVRTVEYVFCYALWSVLFVVGYVTACIVWRQALAQGLVVTVGDPYV